MKPPPTAPSAAHLRWFAAAQPHPAWMLWGKARPTPASVEPAHPLLCHMLDVAWVARAMLRTTLPAAARRRLLQPLGVPEEAGVGWLTFLVALHDLGKVSPAFQAMCPELMALLKNEGFHFDVTGNERDHGTLGVAFGRDALVEVLGLDGTLALRLARAVAAHHGAFASDALAVAPPPKRGEAGNPSWSSARRAVVDALVDATGVRTMPRPRPALAQDHAFFLTLAGFTSVADWVGSMVEHFPYVAPTTTAAYTATLDARALTALQQIGMYPAPDATPRDFRALFDNDPWPLHLATEKVATTLDAPSLVIIEAPMGEGKTEAALLLAEHLAHAAGHGGLYIGLPTQATANQMFGRVQAYLQRVHGDASSNLQLAHGEAAINQRFSDLVRGVYDATTPDRGAVRAERWFTSRKRTLLATHAVGTIDQALLGVLRAPHGFVRMFGLAGKVVVLDEVHAYDTFTSTLLARLVAWLRAVGASVVLLSATLPSSRRAQLLRAAGVRELPEHEAAYPRISVARGGHAEVMHVSPRGRPLTVAITPLADDRDLVADALTARITDGGCAGWICNTVSRAQRAFRELQRRKDAGALPADTELLLLHARLLAGDREARERTLEARLGRRGQRPQRCIVVGTQVLEQSLDVDFDVMATDVAPVDLVLQRCGRLHRHDRPSRPAAVEAPTLLLVGAQGDAMTLPLGEVAIVYEPLVMRRTLPALTTRRAVALPGDIEGLVEAVYTDDDPPEHAAALAPLRARFVEDSADDELNARKRLLLPPEVRDDPFADFGMVYDDDDDPKQHEDLRAMTRLAPLSVDVVCLHRVGSGLAFDAAGTRPFSLKKVPDAAGTRELLLHSVGVARKGLAHRLAQSVAPKAWEESALLRHRRVVELVNGKATLHGFELRLDPVLGLEVTTVKKKGTTS